jgi:RNA polymerase sigma-70 factor (ECF subfamily)
MSTHRHSDEFVKLLTANQSRIYGFIVSLLRDLEQAHEVLGQCNLALLEKAAEYDPSRDFVKWACGFAYQRVLAHRRDASRDRLVFTDELLERMVHQIEKTDSQADIRREALHRCMAALSPEHQQMLWSRYSEHGSVNRIAQELGRTPAAVSKSLARLRRALIDCVERRITGDLRP